MTPAREQLLDQNYSLPPGIPDDVMWGPIKKQAVIVGLTSDIAKEITVRLEREDWQVSGTTRKSGAIPNCQWDLLIVAQGTMEPIGRFFDTAQSDWERALWVNALRPLEIIRSIWHNRRAGAKVVFMSGPNPTVSTPTYTAYRAGKAILHSLVETLNAEYPDAKFVWFIPGVVKTKIHYQTLAAGERAANLDRAKDILAGSHPSKSHDEVFAGLKEAIA